MKTSIRSSSNRNERGAARLTVGIAALCSGLALLAMPGTASGQSISELAESQITIVQTPTDPAPTIDCVPAALAVLNGTVVAYPAGDPSAFKVRIQSTAPLCEPLAAKAVVYSMPGGLAQPWPQTLKEVKPFTITVAGETLISFAKLCDAVQFDLITGDTPTTINNGLEHGALLFGANLDTAYQHPGNRTEECLGQATTVPTTSTTTTTAVVQGSTTIQTTTTINPQVRSVTTLPGTSRSGNTSVAGSSLAATGSTSRPFGLIGGGLVLLGLAAMLASRRRLA